MPIIITPGYQIPVAIDDAAVIPAGRQFEFDVRTNDTDTNTNTNTAPLSVIVDTQPQNGVLTQLSNNSFTFMPNQDYQGSDSLTYHVNDGFTDSNSATVTFAVIAGPIVKDDAETVTREFDHIRRPGE